MNMIKNDETFKEALNFFDIPEKECFTYIEILTS